MQDDHNAVSFYLLYFIAPLKPISQLPILSRFGFPLELLVSPIFSFDFTLAHEKFIVSNFMCHLHWHISSRLFGRKGGTSADLFDQRVLCSVLVGVDSQRLVKVN